MIKTRADLFEAAAKMMRMCDEAGVNYQIKFDGIEININQKLSVLTDYSSHRIEFPLSIVEGRPVFVGDELYIEDGRKLPCVNIRNDVFELDAGNGWRCYPRNDHVSWNPPKPKTVMVELLREDAEELAKVVTFEGRIASAAKKALDK